LNLLLDTHVALWAITDHPRLSPAARQLIEEPGNSVWVSSVTIWEVAIKHALHPDAMPISAADALDFFRQSGYRLLAIEPGHASLVETLPPLHRDPFDRMLVAQAMAEPLRLLTHDVTVASYSDTILMV